MNKETIQAYQIKDDNWKSYMFDLLNDFVKQTKSKRAQFIIENFDQEITKFIHVVPDEVINKLSFPVVEQHKIA
jgi:glutamate synthase (NADPH/NADH) large chain